MKLKMKNNGLNLKKFIILVTSNIMDFCYNLGDMMNVISIQNLLDDHNRWLSKIDHWNSELCSFKNELGKIGSNCQSNKEKRKFHENINTIDHHKRFLNELKEVIKTQEVFMEDISMFSEATTPDLEFLMDHDKTRTRIKRFNYTFKKTKEITVKIVSSNHES